jgi:hypothetical protein
MGMDTFRRRSHRTQQEHRADALADELAQTLRCFADTVRLHGDCDSCATDLAICRDKARALGVELAFDEDRDG